MKGKKNNRKAYDIFPIQQYGRCHQKEDGKEERQARKNKRKEKKRSDRLKDKFERT